MDDSYYVFDDINIKKRKIIFIVFLIIIIIGIGIFTYYEFNYTLNIKRNLKFELGSNVSYEIKDYVTNKIIDSEDYKINFSGVPITDNTFSSVGEYKFKIKYKSVTKQGKIKIVDTTSPKVTVNDLTVGLNEEIELDDFINSCDELSTPCSVSFKDSSDEDLSKYEGEHIVRLIVKDAYNNETSVSANLIVKKDYDSSKVKKEDLNVKYTDPILEDYNNVMFLKFDQAVNENELEDNEAYNNFNETISGDLHKYLGEEYQNNRIDETVIITLYNKYNYVVGFGVKVTLDNQMSFYLSS